METAKKISLNWLSDSLYKTCNDMRNAYVIMIYIYFKNMKMGLSQSRLTQFLEICSIPHSIFCSYCSQESG
jgi:hypothetical protein